MLSVQRDLANVVEKKMSDGEFSKINYSTVPSKAMTLYHKAFYRHDEDRFKSYLSQVSKGEKVIHSDVVYPHELLSKIINEGGSSSSLALELQWKNLPNFLVNVEDNILPLIDVSGSMFTYFIPKSSIQPGVVAIAIGIYCAERLHGEFKDYFMTYSGRPDLVHIQGKSLLDKYLGMRQANWNQNTDFDLAMMKILDVAVSRNVLQKDMPSSILVISDMEFDESGNPNMSNHEYVKTQYAIRGYKVPRLVFWNVSARNEHHPARVNDKGVTLISGYSPAIMKYVFGAEYVEETPLETMYRVLNQPRYSLIIERAETK